MAGQGGKGGGAVQAPNLTDRGTFFNDEGVEMMPMRGPGGAAPIPLSEYNEKYGSPINTGMMRGGFGNMAAQQPQVTFNVNNAAASGLQNAMGATTNLMNSPINQGAYSNAATRGLGQSMGTTANIMSGPLDVDQFNNPYQQQVVDNVQQDIERQRQLAMNNLGAQAQAAGAYGGSRHGVSEGVTNAEYGRMAANALAPLRMQGYNTAVSNAMADRSARLGAAGQQGNLANSLLGNVFNARNQQMGAAGQLSNMANQAFNTGRTINQDLMNQGLLQQSLQQSLIDAAKGDFANYASAPMNSLTTPLAALGASPKPYQQTTSQNPGALGVLGALNYILRGGSGLMVG